MSEVKMGGFHGFWRNISQKCWCMPNAAQNQLLLNLLFFHLW